MKIVINNPGPTVVKNMAGLGERMSRAIDAAANMIASMIEERCRINIASAGRFGWRWLDGLHVQVDPSGASGRMLTVVHDIPYADIFETGGTIVGKPLMWLGLSGTDAEDVPPKDYSGGLFSIRNPNGKPLLFGIQDHEPKYVGVTSVSIPPKFHLDDAVVEVMRDFQSVFDTAWQQS